MPSVWTYVLNVRFWHSIVGRQENVLVVGQKSYPICSCICLREHEERAEGMVNAVMWGMLFCCLLLHQPLSYSLWVRGTNLELTLGKYILVPAHVVSYRINNWICKHPHIVLLFAALTMTSWRKWRETTCFNKMGKCLQKSELVPLNRNRALS